MKKRFRVSFFKPSSSSTFFFFVPFFQRLFRPDVFFWLLFSCERIVSNYSLLDFDGIGAGRRKESWEVSGSKERKREEENKGTTARRPSFSFLEEHQRRRSFFFLLAKVRIGRGSSGELFSSFSQPHFSLQPLDWNAGRRRGGGRPRAELQGSAERRRKKKTQMRPSSRRHRRRRFVFRRRSTASIMPFSPLCSFALHVLFSPSPGPLPCIPCATRAAAVLTRAHEAESGFSCQPSARKREGRWRD